MASKNNILLLLFVIALGAFVKYGIIDVDEATKIAEERDKRVFQQEEDADITGLTILRNDSTIEIVKREDDWYLRQPFYHRADPVTMNALTSSITYAETERTIEEDPASLTPFGLDPPLLTLITTFEGTHSDTLELGNKNATGSFIFAKRPAQTRVFLTSLGVYNNATKSMFNFRDKKALLFPEKDVARTKAVLLERPNATIRITQSDSSATWMVTEPVKDRADATAVQALIQQMQSAEVRNYLSDERSRNLKDFGLDPPRLTVTAEHGVADHVVQHVMLLGDIVREEDATNTYSTQFYGKDLTRDAVFIIDSSSVGNIVMDLLALRNRTIVEFQRADINTIQLDYGDRAIVCAMDSANMWQVTEPEKQPGKDWKISGILSDLEALEATGFLTYRENQLSRYGLANPSLTVTLRYQEMPVLEIVFGQTTGDNVYCLNNTTKRLYTVRAGDAEDFRFSLDDLAETPPETTAADE